MVSKSHAWTTVPRAVKRFAMRHLSGIAPDHPTKIGRTVEHNRLLMATRFITGDGIEIGGLGRPLPVPIGARVKYVDRKSGDELLSNYFHMKKKKIRVLNPDIVANGETLDGIAGASQDFVIANHVIEHFQDPILFFKNAVRVMKPGAVLFLAIPDKEQTFDRRRAVTSFEHLQRDHEQGPHLSKWDHFDDFVTNAELGDVGAGAWTNEDQRRALIQKLIDSDYSIHFHVWDIEAMFDMIGRTVSTYELPLRTKCFVSSGDEGVFVLEKK